MRLQPLVCAFLIGPHEARVTGHISGEDSSETAGRGHGWAGLLFESSVPLTVAYLTHHDMKADEPGTAPRCFPSASVTAFSRCRAAIPVGGRRPDGGRVDGNGHRQRGTMDPARLPVASAVIDRVAIS